MRELVNVDLRANADFSHARLDGARLDRSILARANLNGAACFDGASLTDCGADLKGLCAEWNYLAQGPAYRHSILTRHSPRCVGSGAASDEASPSADRSRSCHTIAALAWGPRGELLAVASGRHVTLWDAETASPLAVLNGHTSRVTALAFSPDGTHLATSGTDKTIRLWAISSGTCQTILVGHADGVNAVAFSPDGTRLATASQDKTARIWDIATATPMAIFRRHTHWVTAVAFSPDGNRIATASSDGTACLWDMVNGAPLLLERHSGAVLGVAFAPDSARLATVGNDGAIYLWNTSTGTYLGEVLERSKKPLTAVVFTPQGTRIAITSTHGRARLLDAVTTEIPWIPSRDFGNAQRSPNTSSCIFPRWHSSRHRQRRRQGPAMGYGW